MPTLAAPLPALPCAMCTIAGERIAPDSPKIASPGESIPAATGTATTDAASVTMICQPYHWPRITSGSRLDPPRHRSMFAPSPLATSAAAAIGVASTRKRSAGRIPFGPCERRAGHSKRGGPLAEDSGPPERSVQDALCAPVLRANLSPHGLRSRLFPALVELPEEAEEPVENGERM